MSKEAMRLASTYESDPKRRQDWERNVRAELRRLVAEQPAQQEPVAYWIPKAEQFCIANPSGRPFAKAWEPLYTSPPAQRKPLTDDELADLWYKQSLDWMEFARAIEAKLKEKNT